MKKERKKNKVLNSTDRKLIEILLARGIKPKEIAVSIGCSLATVYNEIRRGAEETKKYTRIAKVDYSADKGQECHERGFKNKGREPKLMKDSDLRFCVAKMIIEEKYSPQAIVHELNKEDNKFKGKLKSKNTIYTAIKKGIFEDVKMEHLQEQNHS